MPKPIRANPPIPKIVAKRPPTAKEAAQWFTGKTRSAYGFRRKIQSMKERKRARPVVGRMYFFYYDAKHKKTLPVWDRYPLVLPIEYYTDGFLGLNLHFLPVSERRALLDQLKKFSSNNALNEKTRLLLSYELLKASKSMKLAEPCIKRYLYNHLRSWFTEITPEEWDYAVALPVEIMVHNS